MEIKVNFEQDAADGFQVFFCFFFTSQKSCLVQIQKRYSNREKIEIELTEWK